MKTLAQFKSIMVAIMIAAVLVGCNKPKEQTSVNIEDFTEKATVIGKLIYNEGQSLEGTDYVNTMKPAADVTVTAVVANSEYSATTNGSGNLTFTTKTDEEGNFELEIPVTNDGVNVQLKTTNFVGQYRTIVDVENGQAVYSYEEVVYSLEDKTFRLEPNDVEIADGIFTFEKRENLEKTAKIYGTLIYDEGQGFDGTNYSRLIKPAANIELTAVVNNNIENAIMAQTDSEGNFQILVPVEGSANVTLSAASFVGQYHSIIDVENGEPVYRDEEVIYSLETKSFNNVKANDIIVADATFTFEKREEVEKYEYYSEYKVVVGKAAYEKSQQPNDTIKPFAVSRKYVVAAGVDVTIEVKYMGETFTYVAATDNDGVATFNIPTTDLNWRPTITVSASQFVVDKFTYLKEEQDKETGKYKIVEYTLAGYFAQVGSYMDIPEFSDISGMPTPEHRIKMDFTVFEGEEDYGYNDKDEEDEWDKITF